MKWIIHLNILILSVLALNTVHANIFTDIYNSISKKTIKRKKLDPIMNQNSYDHLLLSSEGNK